MSLEVCKLCNQDSTPWFYIHGHICEQCYANSKRLWCEKEASWIDVKDRFPERLTHIIGLMKDGEIYIVSQCEWNDECTDWHYIPQDENGSSECFDNLTHWMPLPEPPK